MRVTQERSVSVNDPLKNSTLTVVELDYHTKLNIEPAMLAEDATYLDTKWWDYRTLHPFLATQYFIRTFYTCAAPILTREVSRSAGNSAAFRAVDLDLTKESRLNFRAWWRARMAADAMGCTYEAYCVAAIRNFRDNAALMTTRTKGKRLQELPYPTQISNPFVLKAAIAQWDYDREKEFVLPESTNITHNPDLWFRADMEAYLKNQIVRRAAGDIQRAKGIAQELVRRGLLLPK